MTDSFANYNPVLTDLQTGVLHQRCMRSEPPLGNATSRVTRSRGLAAPISDIPKDLLTSDWMGDAIKVRILGNPCLAAMLIIKGLNLRERTIR